MDKRIKKKDDVNSSKIGRSFSKSIVKTYKNIKLPSKSDTLLNGDKTQTVHQPQNLPVPEKNSDNTSNRISRKSLKSHLKKWNEELAHDGFAKCIFAPCNFISSNVASMQVHHENCNGVPCYDDKNCCSSCEKYLATIEEFNKHLGKCKNWKIESTLLKPSLEKKFKEKKTSDDVLKQFTSHTNQTCINYCNINMSKSNNSMTLGSDTLVKDKKTDLYSNIKNGNKLSCNIKFSKRKAESMHRDSITSSNLEGRKKSKLKNVTDSESKHIIQPGPNSTDEPNLRLRTFSKQNKNVWILALEKSKFVKCILQNCCFIAMSLEDMMHHFAYCNGDSSFAKYECPNCRGRVTSEAILKKHIQLSHKSTIKSAEENGQKLSIDKNDSQKNGEVNGRIEISKKDKDYSSKLKKKVPRLININSLSRTFNAMDKPTQCRKYSRKRKLDGDASESHIDQSKEPTIERNNSDVKSIAYSNGTLEATPSPKKRGRKPKVKSGEETNEKSGQQLEEIVECAKCDFSGSKKSFNDHNLRNHVGLSWIKGEAPVDLNDEKEVLRLVKSAFKISKKAVCEQCKDVKRSFMGFISHIKICGKTEEEKNALKVQCPHCSARYLEYGMPVHIKLYHSAAPESKETSDGSKVGEPNASATSKKRLSALKAASKFHEVLKDPEEPEFKKTSYILFEKGNKLPKVCAKLYNTWYKLRRENKKIPCQHRDCDFVSEDVKEAKVHYFKCPKLPERVLMCEACDYYSLNESDIRSHIVEHDDVIKRGQTKDDGYADESPESENEVYDQVTDESELNDHDDGNESGESAKCSGSSRRRKNQKTKNERDKKQKNSDVGNELLRKRKFCRRGNIDDIRGSLFFVKSLSITLEEEKAESLRDNTWPQFHTRLSDWQYFPVDEYSEILPGIELSISVADPEKKEDKWRRFKRFEGDLIDGVPTMFTGGSVRCLSWCKVSFQRMMNKTEDQYLALATKWRTDGQNHLRNIHEGSSSKCWLIQIWNCGALENSAANEIPKFALGLVHEGEVWDLAWLPQDTFAPGSNESLTRLGIMVTASDNVRVWSICDPAQLNVVDGLPIFRTTPTAKLVTDEDIKDICFQVSISNDGTIVGGYDNGVIAVWNLKNISSPFCKKEGKCTLIRAHLTIQAHGTTITALAICPTDSRFISSGGLDRMVKLWDVESPFVPVEQYSKELCINSIWLKNWPLLIHNFDEVMPNKHSVVARFVRDAFYERFHPCLFSENACLSISFSDWLNILCGSTDKGEIEIRYLKNFIYDKKAVKCLRLSKLDIISLEFELGGNQLEEKKNDDDITGCLTYEEFSSKCGVSFGNESAREKSKGKKRGSFHVERFPMTGISSVSFNPNFKSFTHIAAGYNCGFVRIPRLIGIQANPDIKSFLLNPR